MQRVKYLILFLLCFTLGKSLAQDISNFTQFFVNPYTLNPSFAGIDGRNAMTLSYRKQWAGVEGGPTIANFSYHTPLKSGLNIGINVANDSRGILTNSGLLFTAAYSLKISEGNFIRFGISGGGSWNTVDLAKLDDLGNDLALVNLLGNTSSVIGNAGISAHLKTFHVGVTMPTLFTPAYVSEDAFTVTEVKPFESLIIHASNRFYFANDKHIFEPYVVYRMNNVLPSQYEVAGVVHLNHLVWVGGSYKQDFGISALGGIKINKKFAVGASYSLANTGVNELNSPSYEIHLSYLGKAPKSDSKTKNKTKVQAYSFIDTEIKKLTPREIAAEKKKQEELEKQKQQEAQAKQAAEDKKKQEEALAQQQAEEKKQQEAAVAAQLAEETRQKEAAAAAAAALAAKQAQEKQQQEIATQQAEEKKKQEAQAQQAADQQARKLSEEKKAAEVAAATAAAVVITKNTEKEPVKEPVKDPVKETPKEPIKETPKEPVKETPKEPIPKEPIKETPKEIVVVPVVKETPKETVPPTPKVEEKADVGPERTYKFSGGSNPFELPIGNYVIVGAFGIRDNAIKLAKGLVYIGFNANYAYSPEKNLWYVHVFEDNDINRVRTERDKYRRMPRFKDAWLLTIE
ncbi:MAG: PorP/SprF family type IX secretion system membrane protein [Cyclobacteriaceae bacterium]|nr:PorP/SprF family type IX secretion system membrane protein [Cyclobacteriaceae bacterium]